MAISGSTETVRQMAQDGADISSPQTMPDGGWGVRGWLSAIYKKMFMSRTFEEGMIDLGQAFRSHYFWTAGTGTAQDFLLIALDTSTRVHSRIVVEATLEAGYEVYPIPVISDNGTLITSASRNVNVSYTNEFEVYHTPTVTSTGPVGVIYQKRWGSNKIGGLNEAAQSVLEQGLVLLLRVTSYTNANYLSIDILHEEETE